MGIAFSLVMLTTGPIWGKTVWGTWWTWDARLTLTLFLFFLFVGYLALRAAVQDRGERARFSAVVGIMGLVLVPFIHLSVYLFRTLHPQPVLLKPSAPSMPPEMLRALLSGMARLHAALPGVRDPALRARAAWTICVREPAMPFETPQNGGFLVAAYVVAAVIYLGYAATSVRRARRGRCGRRGSGEAGKADRAGQGSNANGPPDIRRAV